MLKENSINYAEYKRQRTNIAKKAYYDIKKIARLASVERHYHEAAYANEAANELWSMYDDISAKEEEE